jgi:hypothetical protein
LHFCDYLPFKEDLALYLNNLESPLPKDDLYQLSLIEIGLLVLEKKIFKNFQCIFTLLLLSPLGERQSPSYEQFRIPSPKDDLCQVWLKLAKWFWRRSRKCKSLQTDDRQRAFSSGELIKIHIRLGRHLMHQHFCPTRYMLLCGQAATNCYIGKLDKLIFHVTCFSIA